jgi:hypothetical protein
MSNRQWTLDIGRTGLAVVGATARRDVLQAIALRGADQARAIVAGWARAYRTSVRVLRRGDTGIRN